MPAFQFSQRLTGTNKGIQLTTLLTEVCFHCQGEVTGFINNSQPRGYQVCPGGVALELTTQLDDLRKSTQPSDLLFLFHKTGLIISQEA